MAVIHKMLPGLQISLERAKRQWWFIGQSCVALGWCKHEPQQRHNTKHRKGQQHHDPGKTPAHIGRSPSRTRPLSPAHSPDPTPTSTPPPASLALSLPAAENNGVRKPMKSPATRQIINRMMATTAPELKSPSWKA